MRRGFLSCLLAIMGLHVAGAALLGRLRAEPPLHELRLTSTSGALVLFGKNSWGMNVYALFGSWSELEAHLESRALSLPPLIEVAQMPPAELRVEVLQDEQHKILWSRTGYDRYVMHTPDEQSAQVLRDYVYFHGLETSAMGFSLPIAPRSH